MSEEHQSYKQSAYPSGGDKSNLGIRNKKRHSAGTISPWKQIIYLMILAGIIALIYVVTRKL